MATSLPHATVAVLSPTPGPQTPCERLGRHADWTGMPAFRVLLSELGLVMPQEPGANLNFVKANTSTTPRGSPCTIHQQSHHPGLWISVNRYPSAYCTLLGPGWIWEARPTPGHSPWGGQQTFTPTAARCRRPLGHIVTLLTASGRAVTRMGIKSSYDTERALKPMRFGDETISLDLINM